MTDRKPTIVERIAEATAQVIEYEARVAALNAALAADGDDTRTAMFLSERIQDRESILRQKRHVLSNTVRSYLDQQAEAEHERQQDQAQLEHDRMIVEGA